ncbi:hypothetical protein EG68_01143 [Paragonimus skrjabini miyazakii]|uniref:Uncharacterized protein n=1 Tax=Paragonimus skrjabini miyazakii TaxID=59628 RepID=A0A8S9Z7P3_9TREM|nr:hypothetical protein EG68_01143 [Paragonimus skrjabini miyazakii]
MSIIDNTTLYKTRLTKLHGYIYIEREVHHLYSSNALSSQIFLLGLSLSSGILSDNPLGSGPRTGGLAASMHGA